MAHKVYLNVNTCQNDFKQSYIYFRSPIDKLYYLMNKLDYRALFKLKIIRIYLFGHIINIRDIADNIISVIFLFVFPQTDIIIFVCE